MPNMKRYSLRLRCNVTCVATEPGTGRVLERLKAHNLIVTSGKVLVARMIAEEAGYDTGLTYLAIGTGTATPLVSDVLLGSEHGRKAVSTPVYRVTNRLQFKAYFPAADCNIFVKEVGLFGHSTATATINTGELFNRALLSKDNSGVSPVDLTLYLVIVTGA